MIEKANHSDHNEKEFNGYRLIIIDCKEEKLIVDEMVNAIVGGIMSVRDEESGLCAAKAIGFTRCSPFGAQAAVEACEEATKKIKENVLKKYSPGVLDKIKKMAAELADEIMGGEK